MDKTFYEAMSRDQLIARLKVAEDVLVLVGWCSTNLSDVRHTERGKAAEQAWQQWCSMVGGSEFCAPENHRELDANISKLAAARDRIRGETLARFGLNDPLISDEDL